MCGVEIGWPVFIQNVQAGAILHLSCGRGRGREDVLGVVASGRAVPRGGGGAWDGGRGGRGQQQGRGGRTPSVGVSKHPFLISCDKRGGAPDLWAHFTGH